MTDQEYGDRIGDFIACIAIGALMLIAIFGG